jgi:hypothetical protein
LRRVGESLASARPELACLQGVFDFYNAGNTRLTRGFAVDYATWFRWVLPGLVRLGPVIPLARTTVFFRRTILEKKSAAGTPIMQQKTQTLVCALHGATPN